MTHTHASGSTLALAPGTTSPVPGAGANTEPPTFYLGTHMPNWLATSTIRLFVSHRRLAKYKTLPIARTPWALDSGGFSELAMYGEWRTTPEEYVAAVVRYATEIGRLSWAAPQDWMCEPQMLQRTGLTVIEHQKRTIDNFVYLTQLWSRLSDADCPFKPPLQGQLLPDYLRCWDMYGEAGVDLREYNVVGLGSVCRRQATEEIGEIVTALRELAPDLPLHGFGVKKQGLEKYGHLLASADSMAWSVEARRRQQPLPGCTGHKNCANCPRYAYQWHRRITATLQIRRPRQLLLFTDGGDHW
jgi:hypothetical protein